MTPLPDDRGARSRSFGSVAEAYERHRPGYPPELVDRVLGHGDAPVRRALEVGAGTGKATREVAARGVAVTALEPDPQMVAVLTRTTAGLPVDVVQSSFEELAPRPPVDLLYAAAAWHWTDPATRYERAARWLGSGGTLACFGGGTDLVDGSLRAAVTAARAEVVPEEAVAEAEGGPDGMRWPGHEMVASPWFTDVAEHVLPIAAVMRADDFVGLLSTVSAYVVLPDADRADLLGRIRVLLPDVVDVHRELVLHVATRAG